MEFLSIFSKCGKTAESSSFSGSDGLLMVFGSFFLCLVMFMLWTKTPQGRMNSVMNKVFELALRLTLGDAQDGQSGMGSDGLVMESERQTDDGTWEDSWLMIYETTAAIIFIGVFHVFIYRTRFYVSDSVLVPETALHFN